MLKLHAGTSNYIIYSYKIVDKDDYLVMMTFSSP